MYHHLTTNTQKPSISLNLPIINLKCQNIKQLKISPYLSSLIYTNSRTQTPINYHLGKWPDETLSKKKKKTRRTDAGSNKSRISASSFSNCAPLPPPPPPPPPLTLVCISASKNCAARNKPPTAKSSRPVPARVPKKKKRLRAASRALRVALTRVRVCRMCSGRAYRERRERESGVGTVAPTLQCAAARAALSFSLTTGCAFFGARPPKWYSDLVARLYMRARPGLRPTFFLSLPRRCNRACACSFLGGGAVSQGAGLLTGDIRLKVVIGEEGCARFHEILSLLALVLIFFTFRK